MPEQRPIAYFLRHGETSGNAAGTFRGPIDFPLNEHGLRDAEIAKRWFKDIQLSAIFASPKKRTQDTATGIAKTHGLGVQTIADFGPINVGYLAGEPKKDHEHVMDYFEQHPNERVPLGESVNEFRQRTQPEIKKILIQGSQAKDPVLAVVHSSIIHEVNNVISGVHNEKLVKPGGIIGVYKHPTKGLEVKTLFKPEVEDAPYHG